jgi:hypothetical protein
MKQEELDELKNKWLSGFPHSAHPIDERRFIKYAIAMARENRSLNHDELTARGFSADEINSLQLKYEFLREVLLVLDDR